MAANQRGRQSRRLLVRRCWIDAKPTAQPAECILGVSTTLPELARIHPEADAKGTDLCTGPDRAVEGQSPETRAWPAVSAAVVRSLGPMDRA